MPWIQYTRNFEDVMLRRAFEGIDNGCYLDVGASIPVVDSNTYALYERGWRGIAVEPMEEMAEAWRRVRPADKFVCAAAGARAGTKELHVATQATQISTMHPDRAAEWRAAGFELLPRTVPIVTLDAVLDEHLGARSLHLLSLDVEGAERDALSALDLSRFRPWIMVIEATLPGRPTPSHEQWEGLVLDAGYQYAYFDGINRFYVAAEHADLLRHFRLPPNVWDDFVSYRVAELEYLLAEARGKRPAGS